MLSSYIAIQNMEKFKLHRRKVSCFVKFGEIWRTIWYKFEIWKIIVIYSHIIFQYFPDAYSILLNIILSDIYWAEWLLRVLNPRIYCSLTFYLSIPLPLTYIYSFRIPSGLCVCDWIPSELCVSSAIHVLRWLTTNLRNLTSSELFRTLLPYPWHTSP